MSTQPQTQSTQTEIKKSPFDQTFLCPKCSEILFTKIFYKENTNTPQVQFICPKKHNGNVDLVLFFDLFYSSNKEIENDLSKFDEELDKDIENYRKKKLQETKTAEEENKIITTKSKSNSKEKNKDDEKEKEEKDDKNDINIDKENNENINKERNSKLFKDLEKCNDIEITLSNIIKNKINVDNTENINDNNNLINNNNLKSKSKEKKEKIINNINIIKKIHSSEKEEKIKEEKFLCQTHNKSHYIAYCLSCKKNICKKCLKSKKHKCKMFKNIKITEKNLNELNKLVGQCQESLNKFENQNKILIDSLKEKNKRIILYILSNAFIEINKDHLNEVKSIIKNYSNCQKNRMLNYEIITSMKNIKLKNNIIIPNDIQELINIIRDYKDYLLEKVYSTDVISNNNNKFLLIETFNDIIKEESKTDNENGEIKFSNIIENEKFRNIVNLNDFKDEEVSEKNEEEMDEADHQVEKINFNDFEEGEDMEELLDDEEEELGYNDDYEDYEDDINDEDENNYGDDEDGFKDEEEKDN